MTPNGEVPVEQNLDMMGPGVFARSYPARTIRAYPSLVIRKEISSHTMTGSTGPLFLQGSILDLVQLPLPATDTTSRCDIKGNLYLDLPKMVGQKFFTKSRSD